MVKVKDRSIFKLVNALVYDEKPMPILSSVAVEIVKLVGHILYTKVLIAEAKNSIFNRILSPLAVVGGFCR